ncbi:MAG: LamG domain-containing protein, partial [Caldilineaceae bacterium]|nr:LamG domain-containing protein [Caldilineaceae bacterium]
QWTMNYRFGAGNPDPTGAYSVTLRLTDNVGNQLPALYVGRINVDGRGPSATVTQTTATPGELTTDITTAVNVAGTLTETGAAGIDSAEVAFVALDQMATYTDTVLLLPMDDRPGEANWTDRSAKQNAVTCTQYPEVLPGRIGQGISQFGELTVADAPHLNFSQNQSFSVQGWVKLTPNSLGNFSSATLLTKAQGTTGYYLMVSTTGKSWQYTWFAGGAFLNGPTMTGDSQWHHLVAVVDRGAGTMSLYADGALVKSAPFTGAASNNLPITLAQSNGSSTYDQIAIFNHALTPVEVLTLYRSADVNWQPATLAQRGNGVASTTWSRPAPTAEGIYQIDLRSRDMLGNEVLNSNAWRGLIDTVAPRVTLTGQATGQSYLDTATNRTRYELTYICRAADFLLDESSFDCAGNAQQPPRRDFNTDPVLQARFPDLALLSTLVNTYTVWAENTTPTGSLTACDAYGHCTTANASAGSASTGSATVVEAAAVNALQTTILAPTTDSVINSGGAIQVSVAARSDQPLKEVVILLDGTSVNTISFAQRDGIKTTVQTASVTVADAAVHSLRARTTDWSGAQSESI